MASRPVPAEGSRTRSAGVSAAASAATKPRVIGVENCWKRSDSSERRVCDGSRSASRVEHGEHGLGRTGAGAHRAAEFAQEQDLRRFAGLVGVLPHPGAVGIGGAEGGLHRRAQGAGCRARGPGRAAARARSRHGRGPKPCRGGAEAANSGSVAAAGAAAGEVVGMRGISGRAGGGDPAKRSLSSSRIFTSPLAALSLLRLDPGSGPGQVVPADQRGQRCRVVQQIERGEMIGAADIVAAAVAAAEQDAGVGAGRRLARLHVKPVGMERYLAGDGDYVECQEGRAAVFGSAEG